MSDSLIDRLQAWYMNCCNGALKDQYGCYMMNVAEGGWWFRIELPAAEVQTLKSRFEPVKVYEDSSDEFLNVYYDEEKALLGGCSNPHLPILLGMLLDRLESLSD